MSNLLRRLRKLETELTDCSGLVPHTVAWWDYWLTTTGRMLAGEKMDARIPLEFIDALMAKAERNGQSPDDEGNQQTAYKA